MATNMNNFDLRQAIIHRVQENSKEELTETIQSSIGADERTLPGLGVLFEVIWKESDPSMQQTMINSLYTHLHSHQ